VVAEFRDVAKAYGEKLVLGGVNFAIERHDRVALVGVNGAGKSTLIKLLAGAEPLTRGEYTLGHNAMPDYFAQDQYKELDPEARMLDDLVSVSNGKTITELRSLLGCFLFSEDDVYKPIGVLSGGERNRYALARLLLNPSNFLLLDEPTNHLDMRAKDVLLSALEEFSGTVVFVSHDRYFIDKLATRVFEIENGGVQVFPGNYEDYLYRKAGGAGVVVETEVEEAAGAVVVENGAGAGPAKRVNPIRVQKLKRRMAELEGAAAGLETEIAELETALQNYVSAEETQRQSRLLEEKQGALAAALGEWESLGMELEEAG
jgi:ATP-binding cassette subfamily F protein 3